MFKPQINQKMEVYVNELLVKREIPTQHLEDLKEAFSILGQYQMKLNPTKCAFGMDIEKFLSFIVSKRGIEEIWEKSYLLVEMEGTRTINKVQKLTGQIVALNRFMSKATDKCLPFFSILRKAHV